MDRQTTLIYLIDDDASFRQATGRLLQASGYQVALFESGEQLLASDRQDKPDCILLDLKMSGLDGLELQDRLVKLGHSEPIIFLTGQGDIPASVQAMKAGAEDFLVKPVSKETLVAAIKGALATAAKQREILDLRDELRALVASLTPREHQVFMRFVRGKLNKQIAFELGASVRTIKAHRHAVMEKLRVKSIAEAVSVAERIGILADEKTL